MIYKIRNISYYFIILFLFVSILANLKMSAKVLPRTVKDSVRASENKYWYLPEYDQFQTKIQAPVSVPELTSGMDYETILGYIIMDSIGKSMTYNQLYNKTKEWKINNIKNDTIVSAIRSLYKMMDVNPIAVREYSINRSGTYQSSFEYMETFCVQLLEHFSNNENRWIFDDMFKSEYILKIKVNSIDSTMYRDQDLVLVPDEITYKINAEVLDTLKGRVFKQGIISQLTQEKYNNNQNFQSNINFTHLNAPYSNLFTGPHQHQSILDLKGNVRLKKDSVYIVFLDFSKYMMDYNYDYWQISLNKIYPVIDGKVIDLDKHWSNSQAIEYIDWKNAFICKKNKLLNGEY